MESREGGDEWGERMSHPLHTIRLPADQGLQRPDRQKGSYYADPLVDNPDVTADLRAAHPESVKRPLVEDE